MSTATTDTRKAFEFALTAVESGRSTEVVPSEAMVMTMTPADFLRLATACGVSPERLGDMLLRALDKNDDA